MPVTDITDSEELRKNIRNLFPSIDWGEAFAPAKERAAEISTGYDVMRPKWEGIKADITQSLGGGFIPPIPSPAGVPVPTPPAAPVSASISPELTRANQAITTSNILNKDWYNKANQSSADKEDAKNMALASPMLIGGTPAPTRAGDTYFDTDLTKYQGTPGTETALPSYAGQKDTGDMIASMVDWSKANSNPAYRDAVLSAIKGAREGGQPSTAIPPAMPPGFTEMQIKLTKRLDDIISKLQGEMKRHTRTSLTSEASSIMSALQNLYGISATRGIEEAKLPLEAQRVGYEGQRVGLEGQRVGLEGQRVGLEGISKQIDIAKEAREQEMSPYEKMKARAISEHYERATMGMPTSPQQAAELGRWEKQPYVGKEEKVYPELYRTISENMLMNRKKGEPPPTQADISKAYMETIQGMRGKGGGGGVPPEPGAKWGKDPSGNSGWYRKDPSSPSGWSLIGE